VATRLLGCLLDAGLRALFVAQARPTLAAVAQVVDRIAKLTGPIVHCDPAGLRPGRHHIAVTGDLALKARLRDLDASPPLDEGLVVDVVAVREPELLGEISQ